MRRAVATVLVLTFLAPASLLAQVAPTITQSQLTCAAPNAQVKIMANVGLPAGQTVDYVRVYFRNGCGSEAAALVPPCPGAAAGAGDTWFWVDAWKDGNYWVAILPAIAPETERIEYRTEVMTVSGTNAITEPVCVQVVETCQVVPLSAADETHAEAIVVGTTAACPLMPAGFQPGQIAGVSQGGTLTPATGIVGSSTSTGIPLGGIIFGGILGAGIIGSIIESNNDDGDNSPN